MNPPSEDEEKHHGDEGDYASHGDEEEAMRQLVGTVFLTHVDSPDLA
jgi:hypothetical protein